MKHVYSTLYIVMLVYPQYTLHGVWALIIYRLGNKRLEKREALNKKLRLFWILL